MADTSLSYSAEELIIYNKLMMLFCGTY